MHGLSVGPVSYYYFSNCSTSSTRAMECRLEALLWSWQQRVARVSQVRMPSNQPQKTGNYVPWFVGMVEEVYFSWRCWTLSVARCVERTRLVGCSATALTELILLFLCEFLEKYVHRNIISAARTALHTAQHIVHLSHAHQCPRCTNVHTCVLLSAFGGRPNSQLKAL